MEPRTSKVFSPVYDLPRMVRVDQIALARQMHLCRSDQESWRQLRLLVAQTQAYSAQHVVSALLLVSASASVVAWLIG